MEVVKFGNLIKSPPGIIRVDDNPWPRKWENRYFELVKYNSGEFTWNYFQNESKEKVKKSIEMKDVLKVVDNVQSKNHKHVFCVVTETRKYFFSAPSATASTNWQLALMKGCPHLSEGTDASDATNRRHSKWMSSTNAASKGRCQSTDNDSENDLDYDTYDSTTYLTKKNASVKSRGSSKSSQDSAEFGHGDYDTVSTSSGGRNGSAGSNSAIVLPPQYEDMSGVHHPVAVQDTMYESMLSPPSSKPVHSYQNVTDVLPPPVTCDTWMHTV